MAKASEEIVDIGQPDVLEGETCPICHEKKLSVMEQEKEIPYFGKVYLFSMNCSNCKYHKADIECIEKHDPSRYTVEVSSEDDLKIRIVRSSQATVKIPRIVEITPGPSSNGYVTNVEGILNRVKKQMETARDGSEDKTERKKAKSMLKKLQDTLWGRSSLKIIIDDPTGNSAIISDKAKKEKLKKK